MHTFACTRLLPESFAGRRTVIDVWNATGRGTGLAVGRRDGLTAAATDRDQRVAG